MQNPGGNGRGRGGYFTGGQPYIAVPPTRVREEALQRALARDVTQDELENTVYYTARQAHIAHTNAPLPPYDSSIFPWGPMVYDHYIEFRVSNGEAPFKAYWFGILSMTFPANQGFIVSTGENINPDTGRNEIIDIVVVFTVQLINRKVPFLIVEVKPSSDVGRPEARYKADKQVRRRFRNYQETYAVQRYFHPTCFAISAIGFRMRVYKLDSDSNVVLPLVERGQEGKPPPETEWSYDLNTYPGQAALLTVAQEVKRSLLANRGALAPHVTATVDAYDPEANWGMHITPSEPFQRVEFPNLDLDPTPVQDTVPGARLGRTFRTFQGDVYNRVYTSSSNAGPSSSSHQASSGTSDEYFPDSESVGDIDEDDD